MKDHQCIEYASDDCCGVFLLILSLLFNLVEQFFAVEMLYDQVDVVVRLKDFIELEDIWVADLPQQIDFIMKSKNRFNILIKHLFLNSLQRKFSLLCRVRDFKNFGKVSFSDYLAYVVLASEVDKHTEILHKVKPSLDRGSLTGRYVGLDILKGLGDDDDFIQESYNDALF